MCRFLLAEGDQVHNPKNLIQSFSSMAEQSRDPDGGAQADGSGIAFFTDGSWQVQTSLQPVWDFIPTIQYPDQVEQLLIHARSASFEEQKGIVAYNQPYINGRHAFVFNGMVRAKKIDQYAGVIGAQKLWSLLLEKLEQYNPIDALEATAKLLNSWSKSGIYALNMGLADGDNLYAYTQYQGNPDYYNIQRHEGLGLSMFCSEPLEGYDFRRIDQNTPIKL